MDTYNTNILKIFFEKSIEEKGFENKCLDEFLKSISEFLNIIEVKHKNKIEILKAQNNI